MDTLHYLPIFRLQIITICIVAFCRCRSNRAESLHFAGNVPSNGRIIVASGSEPATPTPLSAMNQAHMDIGGQMAHQSQHQQQLHQQQQHRSMMLSIDASGRQMHVDSAAPNAGWDPHALVQMNGMKVN